MSKYTLAEDEKMMIVTALRDNATVFAGLANRVDLPARIKRGFGEQYKDTRDLADKIEGAETLSISSQTP